MLSPLGRLPIALFAILIILAAVVELRGPATPVQAAPSGSVSPSGTPGIFQLIIFVDDDSIDALLTGAAAGTPPGSNVTNPGRFSECHIGDITGPPCSAIASCPNIGNVQMAFSATCLAAIDANLTINSQQITLLWTCSTIPGQVGFSLQQGPLVLLNGQPVDCTVPASSGSGGTSSDLAGNVGTA